MRFEEYSAALAPLRSSPELLAYCYGVVDGDDDVGDAYETAQQEASKELAAHDPEGDQDAEVLRRVRSWSPDHWDTGAINAGVAAIGGVPEALHEAYYEGYADGARRAHKELLERLAADEEV